MHIALWWLIIQTIGLLALPITATLLRTLPDRGYAFSKTLGLLIISYGVWLVGSGQNIPVGVPLIIIVALLMGAGGVVLARHRMRRHAPQERTNLRALLSAALAYGKQHWREIVLYESVFLLALLAMAWLRTTNPAPWDSERPMDFAFFNAIQRSETYPPQDPWLSGYTINYYYFGYLMMALVAMVSHLDVVVCYNLSMALIFALTALHIAGLLVNMITMTMLHRSVQGKAIEGGDLGEDTTQSRQESPDSPPHPEPAGEQVKFSMEVQKRRFRAKETIQGKQKSPDSSAFADSKGEQETLHDLLSSDGGEGKRQQISPFFASPASTAVRVGFIILGIVLVLLAGNQAGAMQWIVGNPRVVALTGGELVSALRQAMDDEPQIVFKEPVTARMFGTFEEFEREDQHAKFNPWWSSRLVWDYTIYQPENRIESITEFPYFSFWLGDMHPHVMSLPFTSLAIALALATIAWKRQPTLRSVEDWLTLLVTVVVLGSLYMINGWDIPTYTALYLGAFVLVVVKLYQQQQRLQWLPIVAYVLLLLVGMMLVLTLFTSSIDSIAGTDQPTTDIPILAGLSQFVALVKDFHTTRVGLHTFLLLFGVSALPLFGFLAFQRASAQDNTPLCPWFLLLLGPLLLIVGVLAGFPLLAMVGVGVAACYLALRHRQSPVIAFVLLIIALGSALCIVPDLVYIRDTHYYRINTIFKFYYQVWLLWGIFASYALWWLVSIGTQRLSLPNKQPTQPRHVHVTVIPPLQGRRLRVATVTSIVILFALFLIGTLVYPIVTLRDIIQGGNMINGPLVGLKDKDFPRGDGLNAPASPREATPAGKEAIDWLREHASPNSVVLETAAEPTYVGNESLDGYAGVSVSTGIPSVLGWYNHERLWRSSRPDILAEMDERLADIDRMYTTTDIEEARQLLDTYDVTYVYVGELEREKYMAEGLAKFADIGQPVVENNEVTVYAVGE